MASSRYPAQSIKGGSSYGTGGDGFHGGTAQLVDPETLYTKQNIIGTFSTLEIKQLAVGC